MASARAAIDNGQLTLGDPHLRVARLTLPRASLRWLSPILTTLIQTERRARLTGGFRVDDFSPEAADLPEDIQDAELQSRYGGVGGPLFRSYAAKVERRLWNCHAYRALAERPRS